MTPKPRPKRRWTLAFGLETGQGFGVIRPSDPTCTHGCSVNDKIGKLQLILPGGKMVTSDKIRLDPECPEEWHPVASFAEALRRIASDELVALTLRAESGDFDINVEQCLTVLEQCRCEGITPDENFVSQFYGGFVLELEKTVAAGKFRTKLPN